MGGGETQQPLVLWSKGSEYAVRCQVLLTGGRRMDFMLDKSGYLKPVVVELSLVYSQLLSV